MRVTVEEAVLEHLYDVSLCGSSGYLLHIKPCNVFLIDESAIGS